MDYLRGIILLAAGCVALYSGWKVHTGHHALWSYGLGILAIAVGIWRLVRKPDRLRS
jgi:uncharacterized membrane protein HdeD (DUF308 family)